MKQRTDQAIDLRGTVEVPRAALYGFRGFLVRFHDGHITDPEWKEKMRWIDSLLEQQMLPPVQNVAATLTTRSPCSTDNAEY